MTKKTNRPDLPDYLKVLSEAKTLDDMAIGYAAQKSEIYQAFEQALAAGSAIKSEVEWLLEKGSAAGRIYAALLLTELDRAAGQQALTELQTSKSPLKYRTGSMVLDKTVGD